MATINWEPTVALLDADPDIATPTGTTVLSKLVSAGRQYDSAGHPDVLHESTQHQEWARKSASQKLGTTEPAFYDAGYYTRPFAPRLGGYKPERHPKMPDGATPEMKQAYAFWAPKDTEIANRIAVYEIVRLALEANAGRPLGPTNGAIQQSLVSALDAAQAWLAS